jgi:hypothetical protein
MRINAAAKVGSSMSYNTRKSYHYVAANKPFWKSLNENAIST